jgi:hypothetical protein
MTLFTNLWFHQRTVQVTPALTGGLLERYPHDTAFSARAL